MSSNSASAADLDVLRRQIAELRARPPAEPQGAVAAPSASGAAPLEDDPQVSHQRQLDAFHAAITRHFSDKVDPRWAPAAGATFKKDFEDLAARSKFKLEGVDCRMSTCVADVAFDNHGTAMNHWQDILNDHFTNNCAVVVMLDQEPHGDDPYKTQVLFDCEEARASGTN